MSKISSTLTKISVVAPNALPAWMQGLATKTWKELPNTSMTRLGSGTGICAYSGACLKTLGSQLLIFGGGHSDYDGNEVNSVVLGTDNPVSKQLIQRSTNVQANVSHYSDGKPSSRHTYGSLQFSDVNNRMISLDCKWPYNGDNPTVMLPDVDGFSLDTNAWLQKKTYADGPTPNGAANSSCKDSQGNIYLWEEGAGRIWKLPAGSTKMNDIGISLASGIYNYDLKYDSKNNRIVVFGPDPCTLDLSNNFTKKNISFTGVTSAGTSSSSWTYCPDLNSFIGIRFSNNATIYICNANTFDIQILDVKGAKPSNLPDDGVNNWFGRFGYAPELKGIYFLPSADHNVWFFKTS